MNKKVRIIIFFSLLAIFLYVGFKFYCYNKYRPDEFLELSDIKINGKITINHIELNEEEYYIFEEIKFKNIFDGFEKKDVENDNILRMVRKEDSKATKAIFIGRSEQYVDILNNDKEYKDVFNEIVKKENINDDIDLLKYIEKHNDDKVKYFMPLKKQKQIYTMNKFKLVTLPSIDYIKLVDGYYKGYMYKSTANISEVFIIKNKKEYFFTFVGDYTEQFINEFMNTVIIK